jgi:hypothetical protein
MVDGELFTKSTPRRGARRVGQGGLIVEGENLKPGCLVFTRPELKFGLTAKVHLCELRNFSFLTINPPWGCP